MITDWQIELMRVEAGAAGDTEMVKICRRALNGSARARKECERVLEEAASRANEGEDY